MASKDFNIDINVLGKISMNEPIVTTTSGSKLVVWNTDRTLTTLTPDRIRGDFGLTAGLITSTTATGVSNIATTNANTFLNVIQGGTTVGSSTQITGTGSVSVSSDAAGKITINGTVYQPVLGNSTSNIIVSNTIQRAALSGDVTAAQNVNTVTINNGAVTNAKLADMAANTFKGRLSTTGDPQDLTVTQMQTALGIITSVGATVGGNALNVPATAITSSGSLDFTWGGTSSQYVDGTGTLQTFPAASSIGSLSTNNTLAQTIPSSPESFTGSISLHRIAKSGDFAHILNAPDLQAIENLAGTTGLLRKTAANTWSLDTIGYTTNTGTVTSVSGTGSYGGLTLSGTVTTSGNITLGGTPTGTWPISVSGNSATTTKWTTARTLTIGGTGKTVDGTGNVSWSLAEIGAQPSGSYATLDANGFVLSTQLPSYVDDVLEFTNLAGFPTTGETGKIYIALDTNKAYRWSGSTYVYITSGAVDSVNGKTGVVNLTPANVGAEPAFSTLPVNKGGTGTTTHTSGNVLIGAGTGAITSLSRSGIDTRSSFPPSTHTHTTANITALTGYTLGTSAAIVAADTLNDALGKIQAQINAKSSTTGTVTSVGTTVGGNALNVAPATITSSGTFAFTWGGTTAQYVNGQGNLVTFPAIPAGTVTSITAGNGLTNGTITSSGTITLGTPGAISAYSTNSVTSTSHTHLLQSSTVSDFNTGLNTDIDGFVGGSTNGPLSGGSVMGTWTTLRANTSYGAGFFARNNQAWFRTRENNIMGNWNELWHKGNLANGTTSQYIRGDGSLATFPSIPAGTVTSVSGTGSYGGLTLSGTVTTSGSLTLGGTPSGTWPIGVSGNAATATKWATARTITIGSTGKSLDGTANVSWTLDETGARASLITSTTATSTTNATTTNSNTFLNIVQGGTSIGSSTQITGAGSVTVTSTTAGKITITGTVYEPTFTTLSVSKGGTGTTTHTSGNVLIGAGTGAITSLSRIGIDTRASFPPSAHIHTTADTTALTGYTLGTNAALATTDTLNAALGKLQAQVNSKSSTTGTVTSVTAGNGLVNGTITSSGTITLGTPGTLTAGTSNGVTSTSHTHSITTTATGAVNTIVQTNASGGTKFTGTVEAPKVEINPFEIVYNANTNSLDFNYIG